MRPYDPEQFGRMLAGTMDGLRHAGYDYSVRRLRSHRDSKCVTLPLQVRGYLNLKCGDWLAFGSTPWRGMVAFIRVTADQYESFADDRRKEFRQLARKVQGKKHGVFVTIPTKVCDILLAELGDFLIFALTPTSGVVSISAIKGGGDSAGSRRSG